MTGNSSKFFRKILKNSFLVTASGAAIMLSSSGALGAAARTVVANNANLTTPANLGEANAPFAPKSTLEYTGTPFTVLTGATNTIIRALNLNGNAVPAANALVVQANISLGSVVNVLGGVVQAQKLPVTVTNTRTLTLIGTGTADAGDGDGALQFVSLQDAPVDTYSVLGAVTVNNTGTLIINTNDNGKIVFDAATTIDAGVLNGGTLIVNTPIDFNAAIGATTPLGSVTFNNGNGGNAATAKAITATTVTIGKDAANNASAVSTGKIGGAVNFTADGELTVDGGVTKAVTTGAGNEGTLIVTAGDVADVGAGGGNSLKKVTFNNVGASNADNIFATNVTIGNAGTDVTTGTVNGAIDFTAAGKLNAGALVTGTAVLTADGQLTLGNGITGDITSAGNNGTVIVTAGNVANVGDGASLVKQVTFNNVGASNAGNIFATDVTVGNAGTDVTTGTVNGAIDFTAAGKLNAGALVTGTAVLTADGQLTLGNGITGDITSAGNNGTVIVTAGNVANVGDGASLVKQVTFNNVGASNAGNIFATDVTVGNAGTDVTTGTVNGAIDFTAAGKLNAGALVTGTAVLTADGQLTLGNGITGDITSAGNNGTVIVTAGNVANVGAVGSSLKKVTFNNIGASNAGNIFATDVTVGNAGTDVTTGTVNGAIDFTAAGKLNAGALVTGTAVLTADGQLTLGNGITGDITSAGNNGTVIVTAGNVANVGDGASLVKQVTFNNVGASNAGNIFATDVTVGNAGTDVTTGTVNGAIDFTAAGKLNAGALVTGTAVLTADGQLTLGNGITGDITSAGNNGTVIVTAGNVANVGAVGSSLKKVAFNNVGASNAGNIFATDVTVGNAGTDVTTGTVNGAIDFTAAGKLNAGALVTGTAVLTADGQLTLGNGITGDITSAGNNGTVIVTAGDVQAVGTAGSSLKKVTFNGASTLNGAIDAQTITINGAVTANVGAITGDVNITSGTLTTNQVITGDLTVSGGGNLAGDAAATDVTKTVTLQATAGNVVIKNAAGNVAVAGGTLNIRNAVGGINFTGNADATVNVANNGDVHDVNNTTLGDGIGILNFIDAGTAGVVGATNSLKEVRFSGAGVVTLNAVTATNINFANAAVVNATGNITANIDFKNNDGVISLGNGVNITGTVGSTAGTNGTLIFLGSSTVTETIGGAAGIAKLKLIQAKGDGGNIVNLNKDVFVTDLKFTPVVIGPASTIKIGGNLTGNVTFYDGNNNGGTLEFNGNAVDAAGDPILYKFDGAIAANADKGTLNVNTTLLTATSATVTGLKAINIVNTKSLAIDASNGDVILPAVQTIAFAGADSGLGFTNTGNRDNAKIIFSGDFVPANDGQGRITFASANPNDIGGAVPKALTIISDNPANIRKIGTAAVGGKKFANLSVFDQVIVDKTIDLSGIAELDVINGANFVDQGATSAAIQTINIGADDGAGAGPATHTIDVSTAAAVNLLGDNVKFKDAGSILKIQNTVGVNKTVTLANNIVGGVVGGAGDGGIVELNADVAGGVSILTIDGGGGAGKSLGTAANKLQTLIFSGNGEIKLINKATFNAINLNLGVTAIELGDIVQHLEFSGDTTLTETGDIASVDFKGFNATINMNNGTNITGAVTNTGVATNNGTINFAGTGSIGGNISGLAMLKVGAGAVELKTGGATKITEIQGTGTDTLTLPENFKLTGAINSTSGLAVKLNFKGGTNSISGVVGTAANPVGGITTAGTTTFTSAVNSKGPITTAGNTTFSNSLNNIGDVTTSGTTIFTGAFNNQGAVNTNGTTTFKNSFTNQGDITLANATNFEGTFINTGTLTTQGASSNNFTGTFTNTGAVILAPNSVNTFNQQIIATSINASGSTLVVNAGLPINGTNLTGSGTTITLGSNQLLLSAGTKAVFTDQLTLNTNFDGTANTGGNILITGAVSEMDLSGVTKLKVVVSTTNFDPNNISPNTKYTLAEASSEGTLKQLASANAIETDIGAQENRFLKWTLNPSSLVLTASNISPEVIEEEITTGALKDARADVKESLEILARAPADSEARQFEDELGFIIDNKTLVTEVIDSLQPDTVRTGDAVAAINTQATSGAITSAITSLNSRMSNLQVANNQAAVAAGEEDEAKFGIWATPFVGNSTQKMRNNVNGNKSNFNGATVGFDGMLNDNLVLGVAYTRADSRIKQKNDKIGDKSKVNSNIYSIYGLYNLPTNNLFFEAVGSYGDSRVKNHTQHLLPTARNTITSQIAHGKYKSRSYTGQVMVGYDYVTAQANLTPMAGIRYSNIKDSGYTETGTTLQNLIVKGKKYNIVEGLAGAKVSTNVNVDQVILTPELYGLINYGFKNKAPAIDARLQGMDAPFPTSSFKSPKVSYNLGAGVTAKYQMMEYGINYDVNIASKYFAQQGSLKVRVNF